MHLRTAAAAKASGVPLPTLQRYLERGTIKMMPCDIPCTGSGTARGFSRRRILQLAVMAELTNLGISPTRAANAAIQISDHSSTSREPVKLVPQLGKRFLLVLPGGLTKIVDIAPDDSLDRHLINIPAVCIVDASKIVRQVSKSIEQLAKESNEN